MKIKFNRKKYYNDMNIIWDELFSYKYENEFDYFDADIISFNYHILISDMINEYYEY